MSSGTLSGIVTLLFFTVVGDVLSDALSLPVPGSVMGLILLVIYLQISGGVSESLDKVSQFCIRYLAVLFIPGCVGIFFPERSALTTVVTYYSGCAGGDPGFPCINGDITPMAS